MNRVILGVVALAFAAACGPQKVQNVERKPIAKFKYTQSSARPQVFTLDAAESIATVGSLTKYKWTFGDDAMPLDATTTTTQHAYKAAGNFSITLVVSDDKGTDSEPVSQQVNVPSVNLTGPKASFTGPSSGMLNTPLAFDGSASTPDGDLKNYSWSFGDPSSGENLQAGPTKKTASHSFTAAGTYRVTLTVTDSLGQNDTAELQVVIGAVGPVSVCNWTPTPALQGVPVKFDGSASTAPAGSTVSLYVWDFGDGSPAGTGAMVSHTYNVLATFKPKLKVLDNLNRVNEAPCAEVVVGAPPLCTGEYTLSANPNSQSCSGSPVTWGGNKITLTQTANGVITGSETFNAMTITYTGTWAGATFTMTGNYSETASGFTIDTEATINGTFTGCSGWTGTWVEKKTIQGIGALCTLTWNITSTKL